MATQPIYRARPTQTGIQIEVAPPGTLARLFAALLVSAMFGVAAGALAGAVAVLITFLSGDALTGRRWTVFVVAGAFFGSVMTLVSLVYSAKWSQREAVLDATLPRTITFREDGLLVEDQNGLVQEVGWSWLCGVRDVGHGLHFKLAHDGPRTVFLAAHRVDRDSLRRLRTWLEANDQLEDAR